MVQPLRESLAGLFVILIAVDRKAVVSDSGGQGWAYICTVRGSG